MFVSIVQEIWDSPLNIFSIFQFESRITYHAQRKRVSIKTESHETLENTEGGLGAVKAEIETNIEDGGEYQPLLLSVQS